jgi:hypothetical protein
MGPRDKEEESCFKDCTRTRAKRSRRGRLGRVGQEHPGETPHTRALLFGGMKTHGVLSGLVGWWRTSTGNTRRVVFGLMVRVVRCAG